MHDFINGMIFNFYGLMCLFNIFGSFEIAGFSLGDKLSKKIGFSILFGIIALIFLYDTFFG